MHQLNSFEMKKEFGINSQTYKEITQSLNSFLINNLENLKSIKPFIKYIGKKVTNEKNDVSKKLYLVIILESTIKLFMQKEVNSNELPIKNNPFKLFFNSDDFLFLEIDTSLKLELNKKLNFDCIKNCFNLITTQLSSFDSLSIKEDIFGNLYQDLIQVNTRHKTGEYFTPNWLIKKILEELWPYIVETKSKYNKIKILDPSCGSGAFLVQFLIKALQENLFTSYDEIFTTIYGFDINELSLLMTKINIYMVILNITRFRFKSEFKENLNSIIKFDSIIENVSQNKLLSYIETDQKSYLKNIFDLIIGNPPWITLKSMKDKEYQEKVKEQFFAYKLIDKKQTHLFTQLELAALFYNMSIDLYLKNNGKICFVMPKSVILGTIHNKAFQQFSNPKSKLESIWDLQNVPNLFGMPSCVLFGIKGLPTTYPVELIQITIKEDTNSTNKENSINIQTTKYNPPNEERKKSFYYSKFKVGASIFPRNLYFIKILKEDKSTINIITDPSIEKIAKDNWKNISLKGTISKNYLFSTLLAWELLPFGYINLRTIILPIHVHDNQISIQQIEGMKGNEKIWFEEANLIWKNSSTEKSKKRFPNLIDRLNYNNLLLKQELKNFIVLFSGTGTNICSCVIDREKINITSENNQYFIADVKTWIFETDSMKEAHYLSAILNSPYLNNLIKPLQPQGLGGGRAIHRRPLEFPIPEYNEKNHLHLSLAALSLQAHELINSKVKIKEVKTRKHGRELVKILLDSINEKTKTLLEKSTD